MKQIAWLGVVLIALAAASTLSARGLRNGRILVEESLSEVCAVAFSPDSLTLATAKADGAVTLWDVTTQEVIANLEGQEGLLFTLAFSPDGKILASGSADAAIRLPGMGNRRAAAEFIYGT